MSQISVVLAGNLHRLNLGWFQFNARENENCSDQHTGNCAQRIEGLREIQSSLGTLGSSQLRDERICTGFKESEPAGDHKQSKKKEPVLATIAAGQKSSVPVA